MSGRLSVPFGKFPLGRRIRHVGDFPGDEAVCRMQMQGSMQKSIGMHEKKLIKLY